MITKVPWRTESLWAHIRSRCNNPNDHQYANYGGRGIKMCEEWDTPQRFFEYMGKKPPGHTIERINNLKGYEPGNCRWVPAPEQARNTRVGVLVRLRGKTKCVAEWCEKLKLRYSVILSRISSGWKVSKAFSTPYNKKTRAFPDPWENPEYPSGKHLLGHRIAWRHGYAAALQGSPEFGWDIGWTANTGMRYVDYWKQGWKVGNRLLRESGRPPLTMSKKQRATLDYIKGLEEGRITE